jgi:diguanylate cyclase (GGDEF)-like protein
MTVTQKYPKITLCGLVIGLTIVTVIITLINCLYAGYRIGEKSLVNKALSSEYMYSTRAAASVDEFIIEAQARLNYSATILSKTFQEEYSRVSEAKRLLEQDGVFDTVLLSSSDGRIRTTLSVHANKSDSDEIDKKKHPASALELPNNDIDNIGALENLNSFISAPIFSPTGLYLGYIGGTLLLQKDSSLITLIGNQFNETGAKIYIVDGEKNIIFHPDKNRLGSQVANQAVEAALNGKFGSMRITDSRGQDVIAGYSPVSFANWGVITQKPTTSILAPLKTLLVATLLTTLPLALAGLGFLWFLCILITRPLRQLAESTATGDLAECSLKITAVNAWYFEASSIKQAFLRRMRSTNAKMSDLKQASQTDALTGLFNRRAMDIFLVEFEDTRQPISLISLDIDHFKKVNDTFGHDMGDKVLQRLSDLMREYSRDGDIPCRMGGEEFMLLLPSTPLEAAIEVAERLRSAVENTEIDPVGHITISLGVTTWHWETQSMMDSLKDVDELMYRAKREGRNRLCASAA